MSKISKDEYIKNVNIDAVKEGWIFIDEFVTDRMRGPSGYPEILCSLHYLKHILYLGLLDFFFDKKLISYIEEKDIDIEEEDLVE